jgi:predicted peptidase
MSNFYGLVRRIVHLSFILAIAVPCAAQDTIDGFTARSYNNGREKMPYRLFVPPGYNPREKYPLVVWLHGAGGAGRDNVRQISGDQIPGTRTWTSPDRQAAHPAFVLAPQSPGGWADLDHNTLGAPLVLVVGILDSLTSTFSIDSGRLYVAGQSDGGYGVWDLITKRPERFAAAIALCGGGDPARAARAAAMPIWAFHGDADEVIPVTASRQMIAALTRAGGHPRYTEYHGMGHDIWTRAFAEPGLVDWLFAQHK